MLSPRRTGKRNPRRIHRRTPGVEFLETRLALSTTAVTYDVNGDATYFGIDSQHVVTATRQVQTGQYNSPTRINGPEALTGISATAVTAAIVPDYNSTQVYALTGPESYIQGDTYSLGLGQTTKGWGGWHAYYSNFVAKSIVAVTSPDRIFSAFFAIGGDNNVYGDMDTDPNSDSYVLSPIPGLTATSISATYESNGVFRVFAMNGTQSNIYQTTVSNQQGRLVSSAWTPVNTSFVASSFSLVSGPSNATPGGAAAPNSLLLFATSAVTGHIYDDSLVLDSSTGQRTDTGFNVVPMDAYAGSSNSSPPPTLVTTSAVDSGDYVTLFGQTEAGVIFSNQYLLTGTTNPTPSWIGWQAIGQGKVGITASLVSTSEKNVSLIAQDSTDQTIYTSAPGHDALNSSGTPIANSFNGTFPLASLAVHPLVSAIGPNGRAMVFTIGADGSVYVSTDTTPGTGVTSTQDTYSPLSLIPGIDATSIAVTAEPQGVALFAMTTTPGSIFVSEYRPTTSGVGYAWSSWRHVGGDFIGRSMSAATDGDPTSNGPKLFLIGGDNNVYEMNSIAPATASDGYTFQNPVPVAGLSATAISAHTINNGLLLTALTGGQSYVYANISTKGTWAGWTQTGNYVMNQVVALATTSGTPALAGTSPLGYQASSVYSATSGWGPYIPSPSDRLLGTLVQANYFGSIGFAAGSLPSGTPGLALLDLLQPLRATNDFQGVYSSYVFNDVTAIEGKTPLSSFAANSIAIGPDSLGPTYFIVGSNGRVYVNQAISPGDIYTPWTYLGYVDLGAIPT